MTICLLLLRYMGQHVAMTHYDNCMVLVVDCGSSPSDTERNHEKREHGMMVVAE